MKQEHKSRLIGTKKANPMNKTKRLLNQQADSDSLTLTRKKKQPVGDPPGPLARTTQLEVPSHWSSRICAAYHDVSLSVSDQRATVTSSEAHDSHGRGLRVSLARRGRRDLLNSGLPASGRDCHRDVDSSETAGQSWKSYVCRYCLKRSASDHDDQGGRITGSGMIASLSLSGFDRDGLSASGHPSKVDIFSIVQAVNGHIGGSKPCRAAGLGFTEIRSMTSSRTVGRNLRTMTGQGLSQYNSSGRHDQLAEAESHPLAAFSAGNILFEWYS